MSACTFFGHRECPDSIKAQLRVALIDLVTNHDVDMFYVGNQGRFDAIVRSILREMKKEYPQINYAVMLAYMPGEHTKYDDYSDTMLPEGIEAVHPRYAIAWRNNWMLQQSDYAISYITHTWGGAYKYAKQALTQGKLFFNISEC